MALIIGIDMGTTNSAVAVASEEGAESRVLGGEATIPSVVHLAGDCLVAGTEPGAEIEAANAFRGIKRLLGRKANSPEVMRLARAAPYRVAAAPTGDAWVRVGEKPMAPQELAAELLRTLRIRAEDDIGEPVTRAVLAVPAYFDDAQRQAVCDAGRLAGLEVVRLINEPTAAALAYSIGRERKTIAVFDLGGGTFDVSILGVEGDVYTVLASHGDAALGGDDWDRRIIDLLVDELFAAHRFDATSSPEALGRLRAAAEAAKIALSSQSSTRISAAIEGASGSITIDRELSRDEFESETADLCERLAGPCKLAIEDAGVQREEIDAVLLVGGMTKAPMVRRAVTVLLGTPEETSIDPSTAVARGAAVCAAILAGSDAPTTLLDVTSHSLGVRVGDAELPRLIGRGEELPARVTLRVTLPAQEPERVAIELFRGEAEALADNTLVGRAVLELEPAEPGPRDLELTICIDVNSIVSVEAFDVATGVHTRGRLRISGALSQMQLVRMSLPGEQAGARGD